MPFPAESMIYANEFSDFDALIARIKEVNENKDLYLSILAANPIRKEFNFNLYNNKLSSFMKNIVDNCTDSQDKDPMSFSDSARLKRMASNGAIPPSFLAIGIQHAKKRYISGIFQRKLTPEQNKLERTLLSEMWQYMRREKSRRS